MKEIDKQDNELREQKQKSDMMKPIFLGGRGTKRLVSYAKQEKFLQTRLIDASWNQVS
jgi:hypothetical protein